jgi:GNAT superfamily N-acetyltransferase
MVAIRIDPFPSNDELNELWAKAWGSHNRRDFGRVLTRSLAHLAAYDGEHLVGFVNVAGDGGSHAFILDTCVHPRIRRKGIATQLVKKAINVARDRGAEWLHVDFEPPLTSFYRNCGFKPTEAGLIQLTESGEGSTEL